MAGYDVKTGEIFGCKEKSMLWWHEKGHLELHKYDLWKELEMYNGYLIIIILALLTAEYFFWAKILFIIYLILPIEEEFIAWSYCFKHKREWL